VTTLGAYYYLMAQLPAMSREAPAAISFARFREVALRFLSPRDGDILARLALEPPRSALPTGSPIVDEWFAFERSLRLSLERVRAQALGRECAQSGEDGSNAYAMLEALPIARAAAAMDNPLAAERYLSAARIDFIERASSLRHFDSEAVFAYGLTLLLREREASFASDAGLTEYKKIYNRILGE